MPTQLPPANTYRPTPTQRTKKLIRRIAWTIIKAMREEGTGSTESQEGDA